MMRIGCVETYTTIDLSVQGVYCPHCGKKVDTVLGKLIQKGYILFIPFIKKTIAYQTFCPECNCEYFLTKEQYNRILNAKEKEQEWQNVCKNNLEKRIAKIQSYCNPSEKSVALAAIISLFLGLFGMQNLYMGHFRRFAFSYGLLLLGVATFFLMFIPGINTNIIAFIPAAFFAANVYWGIADFIRIISAHAKDGKGRYIITKNKNKKIMAEYKYLCNEV